MSEYGIIQSVLATLEYRVARSLRVHVPELDTPQVREAVERHVRGELTWGDLWDIVDTLDYQCDACG